jgi:hypothetical protein
MDDAGVARIERPLRCHAAFAASARNTTKND